MKTTSYIVIDYRMRQYGQGRSSFLRYVGNYPPGRPAWVNGTNFLGTVMHGPSLATAEVANVIRRDAIE